MSAQFEELHTKHVDLINKRWGSLLQDPAVVEEAQNLLQEFRLAGREISDQSERQRLQSYAGYPILPVDYDNAGDQILAFEETDFADETNQEKDQKNSNQHNNQTYANNL